VASRLWLVSEHGLTILSSMGVFTKGPRGPTSADLRRERRALLQLREERLRDLGGLTLEMYRRDHFNEELVLERCAELVELSLAMVTALAPKIGYDAAAAIAKESVATGKTVRQLCVEKQVLPPDELERVLDARAQTFGGIVGAG